MRERDPVALMGSVVARVLLGFGLFILLMRPRDF